MKKFPKKRYNIITPADVERIKHDKFIEQIELMKTVANDYTIQCSNIRLFKDLVENKYNTYLQFPITDWEAFKSMQAANSSDIYIDGPLGFQCKKLERAKGETLLRISPTVSPNIALTERKPNSFFIRPEDLELYEKSVDIIDFKVNDQDKEDALYTIYKRGTFNFDLSQLVENLNIKVPNLFLRPEFGSERANCGQRCQAPGKSCHLCETQFVLTNTILDYVKDMKGRKQ